MSMPLSPTTLSRCLRFARKTRFCCIPFRNIGGYRMAPGSDRTPRKQHTRCQDFGAAGGGPRDALRALSPPIAVSLGVPRVYQAGDDFLDDVTRLLNDYAPLVHIRK